MQVDRLVDVSLGCALVWVLIPLDRASGVHFLGEVIEAERSVLCSV